MTGDELEDDIRAALRRRAAEAPAALRPARRRGRSPQRGRVLLVAGVGVVVLALVAIALAAGDEPAHLAAGDQAPPTTVRSTRPRLAFDLPGFRYLRVDEHPCPLVHAPTATPPTHRLQSFGTSAYASPLLFVQTIPDFGPASSFGLLEGDRADAVTIRGVEGFALPERSGDTGWFANAILPDGDAIAVSALGISFDQALPVIDGLRRLPDGWWELTDAPAGWHELPRSAPVSGCGWGAEGQGFEVNVYEDAFDSRLQDRVSSTTGPVEQVDLAGLPAAIGDYQADDHWVLAEPAPGLTLEIRASGMTRAQVLELVSHARFVDEAGWQAVQPDGQPDGPAGTGVPASTTTQP